MTIHASDSEPQATAEARLADTYRKIVRIHASLATSDRDPAALRDWALGQLADVLEALEPAAEPSRRA